MELLKQQFPDNDFALLGLVLALPLLGALVNGVFGKRLGKEGVRTMALAAVGGSFLVCLVTFLVILGGSGHEAEGAFKVSWKVWEWFSVSGQMRQPVTLEVAFSADALSGAMSLVVTGVGFLIHLYSTGYMDKDPGFHRFFAYLNLFIFSMLVLILGDNLAVLFVGWEGVGLCSYLLIGFWFTDEQKASAGKKAFITNRIGDFGLLLAMVMLVYYVGTLSWDGLERTAPALIQDRTLWPLGNLSATALPDWLVGVLTPDSPWRVSAVTLVALALFVGCVGKSAQFPLYVWLPDAMAGPTPVSALIHAATMVTAGVYLVARCSFIFVLSPAAMTVVAATGAFTALFAASIAFAQNDLKKVLAYSTVSQLGFMFIGVGVGAFAAGFFHVITHAFFKGCLFLCAGSVIHTMHARVHGDDASQDMRNMGGLRKYMPHTHWTFLVSCLAIAGMPLTSGFFSKDELLFKAFSTTIKPASPSMWVPPEWFGQAIYAVGALAALGTAFYMFRAYFMTFHGDFRGWKIVKGFKDRGHHHHDEEERTPIKGPVPHESPWTMTVPLGILAVLAAIAGFLYAEPLHIAPLEHLWEPVFATAAKMVIVREGAESMVLPLLGVGSAIFVVGAGAAYWVYQQQQGAPAASFVRAFPRLHRLAEAKWKVDEIYDATIIGFVDAMGETAAQFDRWVIDGIIARVTATVVTVFGAVLRLLQTGRVQVYAASVVIGVVGIGWYLFLPHADASVDSSQLHDTGQLGMTAAPGHGYKYRWYLDGETPPEGFTAAASYQVRLSHCETKRIHLDVQNALGRVDSESFEECRETRPGCCREPGAAASSAASGGPPVRLPNMPQLAQPPAPGKHDAGVINDILNPRRRGPGPMRKGGSR